MKTIGLLGGMSWESTALYYRLINEETRRRLGGLHSAKIALVSVDFDEIEKLQQVDDWEGTARILCERARQVEAAGADFLLICTNTMHIVAPEIEAAVGIPLLHLADATAEEIHARGIESVGLLGTRFTMEKDFYRGRLEKHGLKVIVPGADDRETVHRVIYDELCKGRIEADSRQQFLDIITDLNHRGADAVIAGCTEIGMLVEQDDTAIPLLDTTVIHAQQAVSRMLEDTGAS